MTIESPSNERLREIRLLRSRKGRDRSGLFLAEGIRLTIEAAESEYPVQTVVVCPDFLRSDGGWRAVERLREAGAVVTEVTETAFRSISGRENPTGLITVCRQRWERLEEAEFGTGLCWVVLARPQDPGNVGTILRTLNAVGGNGMLLVGPSADPYDPRSVRASMGSIFRLRVARSELSGLKDWAARAKCRVVGASGSSSISYRDYAYPNRAIVLVGSEREGLTPEETAVCEAVVGIPMAGAVDSLNLGVAASLILYEVLHASGRY